MAASLYKIWTNHSKHFGHQTMSNKINISKFDYVFNQITSGIQMCLWFYLILVVIIELWYLFLNDSVLHSNYSYAIYWYTNINTRYVYFIKIYNISYPFYVKIFCQNFNCKKKKQKRNKTIQPKGNKIVQSSTIFIPIISNECNMYTYAYIERHSYS